MKNTTFVSAGAGSGKTYRLTQDIAKMIESGKCRAEEIILTTFTEAAAKELREKVRSTLYSKGLFEAAANIDNAAIGTIHSIAYQFVSRYWYLLGISANVSIMDTEGSKFCISQSLASLPTEDDILLFENILTSLNVVTKQEGNGPKPDPDFWKKELNDLLGKTVELCIDETQLQEAKEESKKLINEAVGFCDHYDIGDNTIFELRQLAENILAETSLPSTNRKDIEKKMPAIRVYRGGATEFKPFVSILELASKIAAITNKVIKANYAAGMDFAANIVEQVPHSPQIKNLIESYIDTIFRLAIKWKNEYEEFKRKRCLLDFGDLLQKFDELLGKEEVVADIQSRYKVAFVDEFQDCSPLQVKSFARLSELMTQSVWVGDIKQAIYGFRGTNTELVKSIIDEIKQEKDGNELDSLEYCWRSNETIIKLVNNVFCEKVFKGQIDDEYIRLGVPTRTAGDPSAPQERELQHIHFDCGVSNFPNALAVKVKELISSGTFKPNEIAILYRSNSYVEKCAKALKELGIAYNARLDNDSYDGQDNAGEDAISSFINAMVSFAARGDNELSKAIVANSIEAGYDIPKLITDRLQYVESKGHGKEWLSDVDIVNRINGLRKTIGNQSVSAAIETLVVELNLADLIKRIDPTAPAYNYCAALESKAATYEGMRASFGLSSTLVGFVDYLQSHPIEYPGDDNGVSVMTYHKSKGLEWPCVILCSLYLKPVDPKKCFYGVLTLNNIDRTQLRLVPGAMNSLHKQIVDRLEDHDFFKSIRTSNADEAKRLMYVGMTRPKEQLILTTLKPGGIYSGNNPAQWLVDIGCDAFDTKSTASVINWGGADWKHSVEPCGVPEQGDAPTATTGFNVIKQPIERSSFDDKFISPSKVRGAKQQYAIEQFATFANRISATSVCGGDNTIGNFIHHVMCLWDGDRSIIEKLANAYGVTVDVENVAASIEKFWLWMEKVYGKATGIDRELSFSFTNDLGQIVNGEIDLVYHTENGDVLVDYKTYQGSVAHLTDESSDFHAGKYAGQISLYEEALTRGGNVVRDRLICYLSLGTIIRIN